MLKAVLKSTVCVLAMTISQAKAALVTVDFTLTPFIKCPGCTLTTSPYDVPVGFVGWGTLGAEPLPDGIFVADTMTSSIVSLNWTTGTKTWSVNDLTNTYLQFSGSKVTSFGLGLGTGNGVSFITLGPTTVIGDFNLTDPSNGTSLWCGDQPIEPDECTYIKSQTVDNSWQESTPLPGSLILYATILGLCMFIRPFTAKTGGENDRHAKECGRACHGICI